MSSKYDVYQATFKDLDELSNLFNEYRLFNGQQSNLECAHQFLFERFEHRESIIFVVKDISKNMISGFTQLYPVFSSISLERSLILNDLFVLREYRKQGLGQLLLEEARRYAVQIKAKGIELSTAVNNLQAQRLYERNGYVKDQDFYHYFLSTKNN
ncbi:GNAT family N-acetyltransferase [Paenibacillus woosongensis]|uniref:GNAT family N-acetyltransferase n=1 Tax=Paenibacillus woosongensis TaxID=307580 RepID=A0AA95IAA7_9BACL|nr:GNAT family N-acetyltransferase [Paenibacillus woosongensis]WHX50947.1 GNAT family N-acetyltransferase [Paenibacillus woosongensis]